MFSADSSLRDIDFVVRESVHACALVALSPIIPFFYGHGQLFKKGISVHDREQY